MQNLIFRKKNYTEMSSDLANYEKSIKENGEALISVKLTKFFLKEDRSSFFNLPIETKEKLINIRQEYNNGADWVGILFGAYNGFAALVAFLLVLIAKLTNRKITHAISLIVGSVSFISIFFITDPTMLIIPFVGIGMVWASILSMPYAMLTGCLPQKKMGVYMGIFNFFIVIPQILAATILGVLIKNIFNGEAIYAVIIAGISLLIASIAVLFVHDTDE